MTETAISAEALTRRFEKGPLAVDGIDLDVRRGEIYGFLGPNGAGKSTTVHMLVTLLPPTSGSATVAGHDVVRHPDRVRGAIGAALQEAALDPYLNAWDHMRLQGSLHGLPRSDRERRSAELIDRVGLAGAAERRVGGYSGGMKRRLDLALAPCSTRRRSSSSTSRRPASTRSPGRPSGRRSPGSRGRTASRCS